MIKLTDRSSVCFKKNSAMFCAKNLNLGNNLWNSRPVQASVKASTFFAVISDEPNFSKMGAASSVFPPLNDKRLNTKTNNFSIYILIVDSKFFYNDQCVGVLNCSNEPHYSSRPVPVDNPRYQFIRFLQMLNGVKRGVCISKHKISLSPRMFSLFSQGAERQEESNCCGKRSNPSACRTQPISEASRADLRWAKTIAAKCEPSAKAQPSHHNHQTGKQRYSTKINSKLHHILPLKPFSCLMTTKSTPLQAGKGRAV